MDGNLLNILVCPRCRTSLIEKDDGRFVECSSCKLKFPVRDGVPVLILNDALNSAIDVRGSKGSAVFMPIKFKVIDGPDAGFTFQLDHRTCRAIGRAEVDVDKTSVFKVDVALELDESAKRMVHQYVGRQFRKFGGISIDDTKDSDISFRRTSDIILTDPSLSRLHAMFFYDDVGLGVLDLVSKNGTFINGQEVESKLISKGDSIEMGETVIVFND